MIALRSEIEATGVAIIEHDGPIRIAPAVQVTGPASTSIGTLHSSTRSVRGLSTAKASIQPGSRSKHNAAGRTLPVAVAFALNCAAHTEPLSSLPELQRLE